MRRMDRLVWPGLLLLTIMSVLFLAINPEILTGKKLCKAYRVEERQNAAFASANKMVAGSLVQQIAFKAHSYKFDEMTQNLKIALRLIPSEKKPIWKNSEKRHDQQFVKASSGLCPGAYEHAL